MYIVVITCINAGQDNHKNLVSSYATQNYLLDFLPAAAHAEHQLETPACDFSLICTLSSNYGRESGSRVEPCYDTTTTILIISSMHTAGNYRKSVPAQIISSPHSSLRSSSTGSTKRGPLTPTPSNHPQLPFSSVPNLPCDSLSHK